MADYWDKYMEARDASDITTKLKLLTECFGQSEDALTRRVAAHDLGNIFYLGQGVPVDKARGKQLMKVSADLGHPEAMNLYGQILTHEGDTESISYFCMALDKAQILAAKNLNQLLIAFQKAGNTQLCNAVEAGVGEVIRINQEDKADNQSEANLTLALVGLYGLGVKHGISVEQGEEYMRKAIELGNPIAKIINDDPSLKHPQSLPYSAPAGGSTSTQDAPVETTPFGMTDVITALVVGAVGGLLCNWIFHTGFLIPFLVVSVLFGAVLFIGSKH